MPSARTARRRRAYSRRAAPRCSISSPRAISTSLTSAGGNSPWSIDARAWPTAAPRRAAGSSTVAEVVGDRAAVGAERHVPQLGLRRARAASPAARTPAARAGSAARSASTTLSDERDHHEAVGRRRDDLLARVRAAAALDEPAVGVDLVGAVDRDVEPVELLERLDRRARARARRPRWRPTSPRSGASARAPPAPAAVGATVVPVPRPTRSPSRTSSAAASAAARFSASRSAIDGDPERGGERLAGRREPQAVVRDQRVGRRGHRLEADQVLARGRERLRVRVALEELDAERAAAAGDGERARALGQLVAVVERAVLERAVAERRASRPRRSGSGSRRAASRRSTGRSTSHSARGAPGTHEVGVVAEGDRHRHGAGRRQRRLGWSAPSSASVTSTASRCGNGKRREALAVELGRRRAARRRAPRPPTAAPLRPQPVDRQPVLLDPQQLGVAVELDLLAADRVAEARRAGSPTGAGTGSRRSSRCARTPRAPLRCAEQLLAAVGQRAADQARLGREGRLELAPGGAEADQPHDGVVGTSSRSETASTISTSSSSERPPPSPSASQVTRIMPVATV